MATTRTTQDSQQSGTPGGGAGTPIRRRETLSPQAQEYYRRIESYAQRIRDSGDLTQVMELLDEALKETCQLAQQEELRLATDRVARVESEIATLREELQHASCLVQIDQLTATLNRRGLDDAFVREAARSDRQSAPLCLAVLDLDNFKRINDRYGHQSGDDTLVHFAGIMRKSLRPNDTVARFGGEEFVVLLPDTDEAAALTTMTRVQQVLSERPVALDGDMVALSFSAGITRRALTEPESTVLSRADSALLRAKQAGKNRIVVEAV